jgi:hypothetical protein
VGWPQRGGLGRWRDGAQAIVNLAGGNLAAGRWTPARKVAILQPGEAGQASFRRLSRQSKTGRGDTGLSGWLLRPAVMKSSKKLERPGLIS